MVLVWFANWLWVWLETWINFLIQKNRFLIYIITLYVESFLTFSTQFITNRECCIPLNVGKYLALMILICSYNVWFQPQKRFHHGRRLRLHSSTSIMAQECHKINEHFDRGCGKPANFKCEPSMCVPFLYKHSMLVYRSSFPSMLVYPSMAMYRSWFAFLYIFLS